MVKAGGGVLLDLRPHMPSILVVGAGAVGCFYASRIQSKEAKVSLICRSNYAQIKARGSVISLRTHSFGDYTFKPHSIYPDISSAQGQEWNYIIIATKALPDTALPIESLVTVKTAIILIQNGVGIERPYLDKFPGNPILSAVTVISAEQVEQGVIVQNRWTRISIGPSGPSLQGNAKAKAFVQLLKTGGIKDAELYDEHSIQFVRWHKLAINASMNPSSILANGTGNAQMSQDSELRIHLIGCMREILQTAETILGKPFPSHFASPEKIIESTKRNTQGRPSMLIDWENGSPLELEAILGNPIREGRKHGIEMPRCQSMYALLKMGMQKREKGVLARL